MTVLTVYCESDAQTQLCHIKHPAESVGTKMTAPVRCGTIEVMTDVDLVAGDFLSVSPDCDNVVI